ncbi:amidophosphoribosyltransferase, partial [candidate division FCPU426 bacterium]|nr:amidophosphoribosyltransferase [candidate division FCPU426 bacterium]
SPPVAYPCFYGMDFPTRQELIAATHTMDEIAKYLRVDSVVYLSLAGMLAAMAQQEPHFCCACFNGEYPVEFGGRLTKSAMDITEKKVDKKRVHRL